MPFLYLIENTVSGSNRLETCAFRPSISPRQLVTDVLIAPSLFHFLFNSTLFCFLSLSSVFYLFKVTMSQDEKMEMYEVKAEIIEIEEKLRLLKEQDREFEAKFAEGQGPSNVREEPKEAGFLKEEQFVDFMEAFEEKMNQKFRQLGEEIKRTGNENTERNRRAVQETQLNLADRFYRQSLFYLSDSFLSPTDQFSLSIRFPSPLVSFQLLLFYFLNICSF